MLAGASIGVQDFLFGRCRGLDFSCLFGSMPLDNLIIFVYFGMVRVFSHSSLTSDAQQSPAAMLRLPPPVVDTLERTFSRPASPLHVTRPRRRSRSLGSLVSVPIETHVAPGCLPHVSLRQHRDAMASSPDTFLAPHAGQPHAIRRPNAAKPTLVNFIDAFHVHAFAPHLHASAPPSPHTKHVAMLSRDNMDLVLRGQSARHNRLVDVDDALRFATSTSDRDTTARPHALARTDLALRVGYLLSSTRASIHDDIPLVVDAAAVAGTPTQQETTTHIDEAHQLNAVPDMVITLDGVHGETLAPAMPGDASPRHGTPPTVAPPLMPNVSADCRPSAKPETALVQPATFGSPCPSSPSTSATAGLSTDVAAPPASPSKHRKKAVTISVLCTPTLPLSPAPHHALDLDHVLPELPPRTMRHATAATPLPDVDVTPVVLPSSRMVSRTRAESEATAIRRHVPPPALPLLLSTDPAPVVENKE